MRLVTYNVLAFGAKPWMRPWQKRFLGRKSRHADVTSVIDDLRPAILGMQEIWSPELFHAVGYSLGMQSLVAESRYPQRCGLLTSLPILRWRTHWFKGDLGAWGKSFLEAELELGPGYSLSVFVVHMPVHSMAILQSRTLFRALDGRFTDDCVILGDFNCPPQLGVPRQLRGLGYVDVLHHAPAQDDSRRHAVLTPVKLMKPVLGGRRIRESGGHVDYIFVPARLAHAIESSRFEVTDVTKGLSDHFPLIVKLDKARLLAEAETRRLRESE